MSETVQGVFTTNPRGGGFLRCPAKSFRPQPEDAWVAPPLIKTYGLVDGAHVVGEAEKGPKGPRLKSVASIGGAAPEAFRGRTSYDKLTAISPHERFRIGDGGNVTMRMVELVAPIGKGTRGLIVSPPKAGKTRILEELATAIKASDPEARILVLLIDERPEEVTHFRRQVEAEVLASSSDQSIESHVKLAEATMAHALCELECGRDVVVLVDSLTRMARAFNANDTRSRRTMSGGISAGALEIPRRFFGLARNIEHGGSVTVLATALVDTGSRMDQLIFEEFKGTGNSEIVLDRALAEARIFPAIDVRSSGTRREDLLYDDDQTPWLNTLRRYLASLDPRTALLGMHKLLEKAPTNDELIRQFTPGS